MDKQVQQKYILGMIGLGTMGRNLLLNMADHGFAVAGFDLDAGKVALLQESGKDLDVNGFTSLKELLDNLTRPKTVMMLVPAGDIVDDVIAELVPLMEKGDLIIDSGNSHFTDTNRRIEQLEKIGLHFFGMGISGGEEGARYGPSMMPGGDKQAYEVVKPILEAISAKVNAEPCVTYIGPGASGHFVKMVHNGIEYALMQLIAETYDILKKGLKFNNDEIHQVFATWNEGKLQSYLIEITRNVFAYKESGADHLLLDDIKDEAKAKGTGKWTSQVAMDLTLPIPLIDTSVAMRDLSKYKELRVDASAVYPDQTEFLEGQDKQAFVKELENAFYCAMIIAYAQGMHLNSAASTDYQYDLKLDQIAKIWRGGCIIRSEFLEIIYDAFQANPNLTHLLLDDKVSGIIRENIAQFRSVITSALSHGLAIPAYASALTYFDTLRTERMPSNLIQEQRDYFGAHTYELLGKNGTFHTEWEDVPH